MLFRSDTLNGVVYSPSIATPTPSTLTGFSYNTYPVAGPSAAQSFVVAATTSVPVGIKAPAQYEVSLSSGSGYADSISLTPVQTTRDSIAPTTVYVRLKAGLTAGTYNSQVVTISSNGATSKSVTCSGTVVSPPTVATQPSNQSVCQSSTATFTASSSSTPGPSVRWQRSTDGSSWVDITASDLDAGVIYGGFSTGTLTLNGVSSSVQGYQYRAVFTNVNGSVNSNAASLTVRSTSSSSSSASACISYTWNGTTYNTSGVKTFTTINAAGCDSVATLNLTIKIGRAHV